MKYSFEKVFIVILAIVIQTLYTGVKKIQSYMSIAKGRMFIKITSFQY